MDAYEVLPPPVKGESDWRDFRCLRLANGVTLVLVHDKYSRTFGAAARVSAGAAADPRSYPGLAHFCEHMCFLGSEKFPGENDYKAFLAQHGGRSNASTSLHATTFYFEVVGDKAAQGALDRFVSVFVAPIFAESGTSREVQAVDSENSKVRATMVSEMFAKQSCLIPLMFLLESHQRRPTTSPSS
jgi:insulysin